MEAAALAVDFKAIRHVKDLAGRVVHCDIDAVNSASFSPCHGTLASSSFHATLNSPFRLLVSFCFGRSRKRHGEVCNTQVMRTVAVDDCLDDTNRGAWASWCQIVL